MSQLPKFIMQNMFLLLNLRDVELNTEVMIRVRKACMTLGVRVLSLYELYHVRIISRMPYVVHEI